MPNRALLQELDESLRSLEEGLGMNKSQPQSEEGLYQRVFGEGIWHNVDEFYGIASNANKAWEFLKGLVPSLGAKETYITPNLDPEDRKWLEQFLRGEAERPTRIMGTVR